MKLLTWLRSYRDKLEAELRGEQRIGNPGERGRVFAKVKGEASITAKVYRAATGKWEDLGKIS